MRNTKPEVLGVLHQQQQGKDLRDSVKQSNDLIGYSLSILPLLGKPAYDQLYLGFNFLNLRHLEACVLIWLQRPPRY